MCLPSQFCIWETARNHRENLWLVWGKNWENTGNLKIEFEWGPCPCQCSLIYVPQPMSFSYMMYDNHNIWKDRNSLMVSEIRFVLAKPISHRNEVQDEYL